MPIPSAREGFTGMGWNLCPECGRESDWDEERSDDSNLAGDLVLYCTRCKIEGRVRRDRVGVIPVKWARRHEGPHLPELEGVFVSAGHVPGGASVTIHGDRAKVLAALDSKVQDGVRRLYPELFS